MRNSLLYNSLLKLVTSEYYWNKEANRNVQNVFLRFMLVEISKTWVFNASELLAKGKSSPEVDLKFLLESNHAYLWDISANVLHQKFETRILV